MFWFDKNTSERLLYKMKRIFENSYRNKVSGVEETDSQLDRPTDKTTLNFIDIYIMFYTSRIARFRQGFYSEIFKFRSIY